LNTATDLVVEEFANQPEFPSQQQPIVLLMDAQTEEEGYKEVIIGGDKHNNCMGAVL
jgi:hypothetical protein